MYIYSETYHFVIYAKTSYANYYIRERHSSFHNNPFNCVKSDSKVVTLCGLNSQNCCRNEIELFRNLLTAHINTNRACLKDIWTYELRIGLIVWSGTALRKAITRRTWAEITGSKQSVSDRAFNAEEVNILFHRINKTSHNNYDTKGHWNVTKQSGISNS